MRMKDDPLQQADCRMRLKVLIVEFPASPKEVADFLNGIAFPGVSDWSA
jgi:hypothetical protein